jgi:hypothetical protein
MPFTIGASAWHGPHHVAQKSSITGRPRSAASDTVGAADAPAPAALGAPFAFGVAFAFAFAFAFGALGTSFATSGAVKSGASRISACEVRSSMPRGRSAKPPASTATSATVLHTSLRGASRDASDAVDAVASRDSSAIQRQIP